MDRMLLLEEALLHVSKYTTAQPWRPGLVDLWVYDSIMGMHEGDYEDVNMMSYIWRKTPDEVMKHIIETDKRFDIEYGPEQLDEEIREYLLDNDFIVDVDSVSDEELQANLEGRK